MLHVYTVLRSALQILAWPVGIQATAFLYNLLVCARCVSTMSCPGSPCASKVPGNASGYSNQAIALNISVV